MHKQQEHSSFYRHRVKCTNTRVILVVLKSITKVFFILKAPLEMQKQQKYFSFRKHSVKCTYNKWSVQNEDSRLQTKYKMQTRYKMKTRYKMQTRYIMQTADCRLHFCTQSAVCSLKSAFCTDQYNRSIPVEVLSILFSISVGC